MRLATTNKIDIKPFKSKVVQADRTIHPVYQRALLSRPARCPPSLLEYRYCATVVSPLAL